MDRIYDNCCGIDVHKKLIVACFRKGNRQEIREFGATTRELLDMADWLNPGGCEMAAMEGTASYWKPLYNILESSGLNAMVVNARHMKAVPGQKMLEGANIKLSGTVSDINGKSARNILEYLLTGASMDEAKYDEMYKQKIIAHNLKATRKQIIDDLNGVMSPLQRRMMKELLVHLDELNIHIKNLDDEIDSFMKPEEKQASHAIHVETVCLLSKLNVKHHIEVELDMDEMDLTKAESKATYEEIKEYVLEHTGMKVNNLYIAQVKQKCGIIERVNYNLPRTENSRQAKCPPEKEEAIREALEYFRMI